MDDRVSPASPGRSRLRAGSTVSPVPDAAARTGSAGALVSAGLISLGGFLVFGLELREAGYAVLAVAVALGLVLDRALGRDLALVAFGLVVMGAVPITTDVSNEHMVTMGTAMVLAVAVPYAVSRFVYRDHAVRFPIRTGEPWTPLERGYLVAVPLLGYAILPVYMISTGVYRNWPAVSDPEGIGRLFLGTNVLGIWDELFFICTAFTLLRRHLSFWQANVLQAVLFTSFLFELGFHSWGPVMIYAFALIQGYIFQLTRSLTYVVCVHLLFDFVLFLVLVHAHNRTWLDFFVY